MNLYFWTSITVKHIKNCFVAWIKICDREFKNPDSKVYINLFFLKNGCFPCFVLDVIETIGWDGMGQDYKGSQVKTRQMGGSRGIFGVQLC